LILVDSSGAVSLLSACTVAGAAVRRAFEAPSRASTISTAARCAVAAANSALSLHRGCRGVVLGQMQALHKRPPDLALLIVGEALLIAGRHGALHKAPRR
jgi:hypothetical protein